MDSPANDDKLVTLAKWLVSSGVLEGRDKVVIEVTKENISVTYYPPVVEVAA
jgi:hypothetical protein